jgi:hypothetical protein
MTTAGPRVPSCPAVTSAMTGRFGDGMATRTTSRERGRHVWSRFVGNLVRRDLRALHFHGVESPRRHLTELCDAALCKWITPASRVHKQELSATGESCRAAAHPFPRPSTQLRHRQPVSWRPLEGRLRPPRPCLRRHHVRHLFHVLREMDDEAARKIACLLFGWLLAERTLGRATCHVV